MFHKYLTTITLTFVNLAAASPTPAAQDEAPQVFASGAAIPNVTALANPRQSYALYLPLKYSREHRWPVVYVFDPGARGQLALQQFQHAAELHPLIVAASNNSRNGPWAPEFEAADAMIRDTQQRFSVDLERIYFAGFSGGARVASQLAQLCKCAAGVLLSGAGFSHSSPPSRGSQFAVFSAIGNADFNYREVIPLEDALEKAASPHWLRVFDGRHEWAPPMVMDEALAWFRVQAVKSDREASPGVRDDAFLSAEFAAAQVRVVSLEQSGDLLFAWREYRQIAVTFETLTDVSAIRAKAAQLENQKSLRDAAQRERNDFEEQRRLSVEVLAACSASNRDNSTQTESAQSAMVLAKDLRVRAANEKKKKPNVPSSSSALWLRSSSAPWNPAQTRSTKRITSAPPSNSRVQAKLILTPSGLFAISPSPVLSLAIAKAQSKLFAPHEKLPRIPPAFPIGSNKNPPSNGFDQTSRDTVLREMT